MDHLRDPDAVARMSREELEAHAKALRAVNAITHALIGLTEPDDILTRAIEAVAEATHFPAVACFRFDARRQTLELIAARGFQSQTLEAAATLPLDGSLTGEAVRAGKLITTDDVATDARSERRVRSLLGKEGFNGVASMPLVAGTQVIGAMNLIYKGEIRLRGVERELIESIGAAVALTVQRATRLAAERAWRAFLSEANEILASSLEYEETLRAVARLSVPILADWCVIDILESDGSVRRLAGAHADAKKKRAIDALIRDTNIDPGAAVGVAAAVREGRTLVHRGVSEARPPLDAGIAIALGVAQAQRVSEIGGSSFLCVPLRARGRTLGAVSFVYDDELRPAPFEVERAEQLARCCALAIDNARLYQEACDAIATRDEFLLIASHELKTPVQALDLSLHVIARHTTLADQAYIARARAQVQRLSALIESLLDVSRLAAGRLALHVADADLGEVVSAVLERLRPDATRAGCSLAVDAAPIKGRWDRGKIEQAVASLVSNAIKYGPGKPIEVAVARQDHEARVSVSDHGIGVAKEDEQRIFGRFERAVSSRHYGGFGLGLYIARGIAEAHGGRVNVASAPGAGSTFTLVLPVVDASDRSDAPHHPARDRDEARGEQQRSRDQA